MEFMQVSNHFGSLEGGHYTAYCNSNVQRRWHKFDDQVFNIGIDPNSLNLFE